MFLRRLLILANAPSAPQISLPSGSGHISPSVAILLARFRSIYDPHSKCVKCMGFSHAREAVYGMSKCKFSENICLKIPVVPRRPLRPSVNSRPGVRMWSSRRWRVSRRALPFLSLSHLSTCVQVLRLNSHTITYILARSNATPFPSG